MLRDKYIDELEKRDQKDTDTRMHLIGLKMLGSIKIEGDNIERSAAEI